MKKYILIGFLILSVASYSKAPRHTFSRSEAGSINAIIDSIEQNDVAVIFQFNKSFKNMPIEIIDANTKQILALKGGVFDQGNLSKDGESGDYIITILKDRKLKNSLETSINPDMISLKLNNSIIGSYILPKPESKKTKDSQDKRDGVDFEYKQKSMLQDVIYIRNGLNNPETYDTIKKILERYYFVKQFPYTENTYLNDVLKDKKGINIIQGENAETKSTETNLFTSTIASIGGLDVTTIADGMAKFIVKRTKQELSIAFFDKFKAELDKQKDLQTIFPQTYRSLSAIGEDIYMYDAYLQTLRESFKKDLASLSANVPGIIENHPDYFDKVPELKASLQTGFYVAQGIQNEQHIGEVIENYPVEYLESDSLAKATFQTLQLISTSLRSDNDTTYWASPVQIKQLLNDKQLLNIYLGLLEQKAKKEKIKFKIKQGDLLTLAEVIDDAYENISPIKAFVRDFALKTEQLEARIKAVKSIKNDSIRLENYYGVISASIDLMKQAVTVENLPALKDKNLNLKQKTSKYFDLAQTASELVIDINKKNYASAIINVAHVYGLVISDQKLNNDLKKAYEKKISSKSKTSESTKSIEEITTAKDKLSYDSIYNIYFSKKDAINGLIKYGTFVATMAQAKTSTEVEAAIEAVALPAGSARIKRKSNFNVSLNAYCGLYWGSEKIKGVDNGYNEVNFTHWNSFGLTAPIGIAASWGNSIIPFTHFTKEWSSTLFVSLIDIGALAAYRFNSANDSISSVPKITLENIISPGIFYSIGFPKSPISINLGYQIGPMLRKVEKASNTIQNERYSRFSVSVCVDLPLLNIYNKSR
jgi:hypothetical protein